MRSFFRVISFAFQDIVRNMSLSFMTVLILVLMLLSMNTIVVVRSLTGQAVSSVKDQIDVSVHFRHTTTQEQIDEVEAYVASFPEVTDITLQDSQAVLEEFKERHEASDDILASIEELGENPLGATMIVKTREPQDYQKIIDALSVPEYEATIEAKTFQDTEKTIERVTLITQQVERAVVVLSIFFAVIAFFVIFNTVRVAIYTQRKEIGIKKLVGASDWFVRGPYIIESFIFSVVSMAVTLVIMFVVLGFLDPYIRVIFGTHSFLTNYYQSHILLIVGSQFLGVLLLTMVTSGLAMRRYLRT